MRIVNIFKMCLIFILTIYVHNSAFAKTLYVHKGNTSASDSYSWSQNDVNHPWLTIEKGLTSALAGDTVIIKGGPYTSRKNLCPSNSGTSSSPIIIKGETNAVTIDGYSTGTTPVFELQNVSWITIQDLTIRYGGRTTIRLGYDYSASNIVIQNCRLSGANDSSANNPAAITINKSSDNVYLQNNEIYNTTSGHGISLFSCGNVSITGNHIHDLKMQTGVVGQVQAILIKHKPYGVISIRNNWIHNVYSGFMCNLENSSIENNLMYNLQTYGIWGSEGMGGCSTQGFSNNTIRHNTIISSSGPAIMLDKPDDGCSNGGARSNIIKDNILITKTSTTSGEKQPLSIWTYNNGVVGHSTTLDYNLYYQPGTNRVSEYGTPYSYSSWKSRYSTDAHSLSANPIFVNPSSPSAPKDFGLLSSSPGKGKASDQKDIGIIVSLVGTGDPSYQADTTQPLSPTGLQINVVN